MRIYVQRYIHATDLQIPCDAGNRQGKKGLTRIAYIGLGSVREVNSWIEKVAFGER